MSVFGDNLHKLIISHGYTKSTLAAKLNTSEVTIHRWLKKEAKPTMKYKYALSTLFKIMPNDLIENKLCIKIPTEHTGAKIRKIRTSKGMHLSEVGAKCLLTGQTLSRIERGVQIIKDMNRLKSIAKALEVTPEELLN